MRSQPADLTEIGNPQGPTYFVSDAHIGAPIPGHEDRERSLLSFLRSLRTDAGTLFILGDLFDFWIEYRYAVRPDYFRVIHELRLLVEHGVEVHYMAGNHDFALGPFLSDTVGLRIHRDHMETQLQGKRLHLYHGDGLVRADTGYRVLRRILRNPVNQRIYRLLHPDIGVPLGAAVSGSSRKLLSLRISEKRLAEYRVRAREFLQSGSDVVIFGHTHRAELINYGDKVYCNTGEWIRKYTFARMEKGVIRLFYYVENAANQEIAPIFSK